MSGYAHVRNGSFSTSSAGFAMNVRFAQKTTKLLRISEMTRSANG
jgi:hypothetical protein